jgi:hypothetical protein
VFELRCRNADMPEKTPRRSMRVKEIMASQHGSEEQGHSDNGSFRFRLRLVTHFKVATNGAGDAGKKNAACRLRGQSN